MEASTIKSQKVSVQLTADTILSAQQLYRHDPLLFLLKDKFHLRTLWMSIGAVLPPAIVYLSWWLLWGRNFPSGKNPGNIASILLQVFVLFPALFFIYASIPTAIAKTFNTLYTNGIIGKYRQDHADKDAYTRFNAELVSWMDKNWWTVALIGIIIIYTLLRLFLRELPEQRNFSALAVRAAVVIIYIPLMLATGMSVIRLVLALIFVNRLFYLFELQIEPAYSDGTGKLVVFRRLLWLCVSIMLWVTLLLTAMILGRSVGGLTLPEVFILGTLYILLIPTILIGWLVFPHLMMVKARDEALQPLASEYQQALMQALSPQSQGTQSLATETLYLEALKKRYDLIYASFPVWPIEIGTVSSAAFTVILPVILPLILPLILPSILSFFSSILQHFVL